LFISCESGNKNLVKYLVEHGEDVNKENKSGKTLHYLMHAKIEITI